MNILFKRLCLMIIGLASAYSWSHSSEDFSILTLNSMGGGTFQVVWTPSASLQINNIYTTPVFSKNCRYTPPILNCENEQAEVINFQNLPDRYQVIIRTVDQEFNTSFQFFQRLNQNQQADNSIADAFSQYLLIGVQHIIFGYDHLAFVITLILLVGFNRKLIWCVTAFTMSHSITLIMSALDMLTVSITPVEIIIALSIVFVSKECLTKTHTFSKQFPWLVALGFGLIHGLGFAGALSNIGLPKDMEILALLAFNLGVELGQIFVILLIFIALKPAASVQVIKDQTKIFQSITAYVCGTLGMLWVVERMLAL